MRIKYFQSCIQLIGALTALLEFSFTIIDLETNQATDPDFTIPSLVSSFIVLSKLNIRHQCLNLQAGLKNLKSSLSRLHTEIIIFLTFLSTVIYLSVWDCLHRDYCDSFFEDLQRLLQNVLPA